MAPRESRERGDKRQDGEVRSPRPCLHNPREDCLFKGLEYELVATDMAGNESSLRKVCLCLRSSTRLQTVASACVVMSVAFSWALASQFAKTTLFLEPEHFQAPYFLMWFSTNFMVSCYPTFLLYSRITGKNLKKENR